MSRQSRRMPLSLAQRRLWLLYRLHPDQPADLIVRAERLIGPLDIAALTANHGALLRRHPILRAVVETQDDEPALHIRPFGDDSLPVIVLDMNTPAAGADPIQRWIEADLRRGFDLTEGPLLRVTLLRCAEHDHILVVTAHRLVADRASLDPVIGELLRSHAAPTEHDTASLAWDASPEDDHTAASDAGIRRLSDTPPHLDLPTDLPRPPVQGFTGGVIPVTLPASLVAALADLCARSGVTLADALLAVWQVLLARYADQEEFLIGVAASGRATSDMKTMIGPIEETHVVRADLTGDPSFVALLDRVSAERQRAHTADMPTLDALIDALSPAADPGRNPLAQTHFAFDTERVTRDAPAGLTTARVEVESATTRYDVALAFAARDGLVRGTLTYRIDLFRAGTIARMRDHYLMLLAGAVADPTRPIADLPLLTEAERQQLLVAWNDTAAPFPEDRCSHELFEACAARVPDAVAVICDGRSLTYGELNARANHLAHRLRDVGVRPEDPVVICLGRSVAMAVAILGVLKAGGVYVPLDPAYPAERITFILTDSGAGVLIADAASVTSLPATGATVIHLDADGPTIAATSGENPVRAATPENLAYMIYTSGSTGAPKGVLVTHRNLISFIHARFVYYHEPIHAFLLLVPIAFDASVGGIFATLCQGGALVIPTEEELRDPRALAALIQQHQVSHFSCVPSLYALLLALAAPAQLARARVVVVGGETCTRALVAAHHRALPGARLCNDYGPTECTVWSSVYECIPDDPHPRVPIGRPIANTRLFVLDDRRQPVPIGVPGELCISGAGLSRGYHRRPDLTAERFVPHPFPLVPGERMYRTGDLVRYLPDGNIEFLGRLDHQVKVRGVRVELGEIEAALLLHEGVREAVVLPREEARGERRLEAYVVPSRGEALTDHALRRFLAERLPREMVPGAFVLLDTLPLTPHGKVDRRALLAREPERPDPAEAFVAPRDDLEARLAALWEETLDVRPVSVHDDFFELGGHSLLVIRLFARIEEAFGTRLPAATLFRTPTIARLARIIREDEQHPRWSSLVPMQPLGDRPPFFCVHGLGGSVLNYADLARRMAPDQPFYGIQAREVSAGGESEPSLVETAAAYLAEMRAVQSVGPYFLGGFSAGGLLAYEIAQQVRASGGEVALLAMLDAPAPGYWDVRITPTFLADFARDLPHTAREIVRRGVRPIPAQIALHASVLWQVARERLRRRGKQPNTRLSARLEYLRRGNVPDDISRFAERYERMMLAYQPRRYPGRVTVFRSRAQRLWGTHAYDLGWGALAPGRVDVHVVPGQHETILYAPQVDLLAHRLRARLAEAHEQTCGAG